MSDYIQDLENIAIACHALIWAGVEDWEGYARAAARLQELTQRALDDPDFGPSETMELLRKGAV